MLVRRSLGDDLSAVHPGTRSDVHKVVGRQHHVLVVFHHQDGIAGVAQGTQAVNQLAVVPLVQPNARLVEDVKHLGEPAPNLRGQTNALRLAAADAARGTVQAEVAQPHVEQEAQARTDLFQRRLGDGGLAFGELAFQAFEEGRQIQQVHLAQLADVAAAQLELKAHRFQPGSFARWAGDPVHERLCPTSQGHGLGLFRRTHDGCDEAFERHRSAPDAAAVLQLDVLVTSVQDFAHHRLGDVTRRCGQGNAVVHEDRFDDSGSQVVFQFAQRGDASLFHRDLGVRHQGCGVHLRHFAQPVAGGASTVGAVEAEQVGLRIRVRQPGGRTHEVS